MKRHINPGVLSIICLLLAVKTSTAADEWGTLSGKFVFDGNAPVPSQLQITKDIEYCGQFQDEIVDQSLLVAGKQSLTNVIVWLRPAERGRKYAIHADYQNPPDAVIDNIRCMFYPHVIGVWAEKQKLVVKNSDPIGQALKIDLSKNPSINVLMPIGGGFEHKFAKPERLPARVSCGVHPWESAWVMVHDTPYFSVSDKDGSFTIENLPVGKLEFQAWHEKAGYLEAKPDWKRGRFTMEIKPGQNDLGEIKVSSTLFQ